VSSLLARATPTGDEHERVVGPRRVEPVTARRSAAGRPAPPDPAGALLRLRRAEAAMASELAAVREALADVEAALAAGPVGGAGLLTVVEAARELRVSRSRVFDLLAAGELEGVMIGRARCVPRRSIDDFLVRLGAA
jgi:excisionase family DNA binding protein